MRQARQLARRSLHPVAKALLVLPLVLHASNVRAVTVEESTLSPGQAVVVQFTADEVARAVNRAQAASLGVQVATQMIRLAGIPESFSGKVAAVAVWATLCAKYTADINREAKRTAAGNGMTLKYQVDLDGVRAVWEASGAADNALPGSEATGIIIDVLNRLLNCVLQ